MKMRNEKAIVIWIVIGVLLFFSFGGIGTASALTLTVDDDGGADFTRIQDAVDASSDGDTIIVRDGSYTENVDVNKRLTIRSENGSDKTIVQPKNLYDRIFKVTADCVNITGFMVTGTSKAGIRLERSKGNTIAGNNFSNNHPGVDLYYSNDNTIVDNIFVNDGLYVWHSYQNAVENNTVNGKPLVYLEGASDFTITDAGQVILIKCNHIIVKKLDLSNTVIGVKLWETDNCKIINDNTSSNDKYGIYLYMSKGNLIANNLCFNNRYGGISVGHSSSDNTIINNIASNNYDGIYLWTSSSNIVKRNSVSNNKRYGIGFWTSSNNIVQAFIT